MVARGGTRACQGVVLVVPVDRRRKIPGRGDHVVAGGPTRAVSVRAGLEVAPTTSSSSWCTTPSGLWRAWPVGRGDRGHRRGRRWGRALLAGGRHDQATPGRREARDPRPGSALGSPDPAGIYRLGARAAHAPGREATDDAALVEAMGGHVVNVEGEVTNLKITPTLTWRWPRRWWPMGLAHAAPGRLPGRRVCVSLRIGQGFDIQPSATTPGVAWYWAEWPCRAGPWRATATPTSSAMPSPTLCWEPPELGDIGTLFPDSDPAWPAPTAWGCWRGQAKDLTALAGGQCRLYGHHRGPPPGRLSENQWNAASAMPWARRSR